MFLIPRPLLFLVALTHGALQANEGPRFRAVEIDSKIEIGYGVTVTDVDGDSKPDILLVDKKQIAWYRNPRWEKFVIAENLTKLDNVCIAAADLNGDGKAEIAVGAGWNPSDTINSGAVFYLLPSKDRTQKWEAIELPHEPTVHRMRWLKSGAGQYGLVVVPLHGRGNQGGEGAGVKILRYLMPADPQSPWKTELLNDSLHMSHNFDVVEWSKQPGEELLVAAKEGIFRVPGAAGSKSSQLGGNRPGESGFAGAGEVRAGKLGPKLFVATVEPMHGNQLVLYTEANATDSRALWERKVLDTTLKEGHALACHDFLGNGSDQIIVGWRATNSDGKVGIKIFTAVDKNGERWSQNAVDDNTMACEDLCVADLDGDGKPDIVASGRATRNVKAYFNTTGNADLR